MAGGKWMGWWGHLGGLKQRGIVTYSLSPYEQRAFSGALHQAVFNTFRRVSAQVFYIGTPFGLGYATYVWAKANHEFRLSKAGHAYYGPGEH
ncbi:UcrQ family protein [Gamsiella multidivaricata]|uniref:UcrQ family protein n=1 Tax=Gamsiella multidivaricata TaxID=101098 RepID=UPI0022205889|nr:UcrQ family protein [Gamsiella multidivaricata]KAG0369443.1 ubiquinol--cytochrome-c reductase subunit 8 [Gamsiella multidivaricata]KAI7821389.1 UcrQ family protein [Gamsiella multidivaricata]